MKVVLINGAGGSGKDTLVELFRTYVFNDYTVGNISTIDKIKSIAQTMGWKGEKDEKGYSWYIRWCRLNSSSISSSKRRIDVIFI